MRFEGIVAGTLAVILLVSTLMLALTSRQNAVVTESVPSLEIKPPELEITVNGKTVYRGPDPPTSNFVSWMSAVFGSNLQVYVTTTGGASKQVTGYYGDYYGYTSNGKYAYLDYILTQLYVALGSGSGTFSRSTYKMASEIVRAPAGTSVGYNSTHVWLDIVASYQFSQNTTLREVGLIAHFDQLLGGRGAYSVPYCDTSVVDRFDALLLYTPIPDVNVVVGDQVVVRYRFYFTKPFTVQMAYLLALALPPDLLRMTYSQTLNTTSGQATFRNAYGYLSYGWYQCVLPANTVLYYYLVDVRQVNPQVYLAYGTGTQPWSIWDRDVYAPVGRANLEAVTASGNSVQMVFYISNPGPSDLHITELALQLNTTDVDGNWRLITLARWTVDYTVAAGTGVNIAVRVAVP